MPRLGDGGWFPGGITEIILTKTNYLSSRPQYVAVGLAQDERLGGSRTARSGGLLGEGRVPASTWADGGAGERGGGPVGGESPCDPEPVDTEGSDSPTR